MKQVFLSYSRNDSQKARNLYRRLNSLSGVRVWFDKEDLLPGLEWRPAIRKAIRESNNFIALLSRASVSKRGYRHTELRQALEIWQEFPEGKIFLIPARLDACKMPFEAMTKLTYADLFPSWDEGVTQIQRVLLKGTPKMTRKLPASTKKQPSIPKYHYRIGLADLSAGLLNLRQIAKALNHTQTFFHFTLSTLPRVDQAVRAIDGIKQLAIHELPRPFYSEYKLLNVDQVICLTRYLLAFKEDKSLYFNYLAGPSNVDERFMFVSTSNLYDYTKRAGCKYEAGIIFLVVSQLAAYFTTAYHDETRGCVMDFTREHKDIVKGLKQGKFCSSCSRRLSKNKALYNSLTAMLKWARD